MGVEVIVPVEHDRNTALNEELVYGGRPAGAALREPIRAIGIFPAPFIKRGSFGTAAVLNIRPTNQLVDENEFKPGTAPLKGALEPAVLFGAEGGIPEIVPAATTRCGPVRIQHNEQSVSPFPSVVILEPAGFGMLVALPV